MNGTSDAKVVLVVDDEPVVLNFVCGVLRREQVEVLRAASADEALEIAQRHQGPIHLMIVDVIMPGLTGPKMAELFATYHPETRCLFMAGLTESDEVQNEIVLRGLPLIAKPFFPRILLEKVRALLNSAALMAVAV